jgi:hypothetical protein
MKRVKVRMGYSKHDRKLSTRPNHTAHCKVSTACSPRKRARRVSHDLIFGLIRVLSRLASSRVLRHVHRPAHAQASLSLCLFLLHRLRPSSPSLSLLLARPSPWPRFKPRPGSPKSCWPTPLTQIVLELPADIVLVAHVTWPARGAPPEAVALGTFPLHGHFLTVHRIARPLVPRAFPPFYLRFLAPQSTTTHSRVPLTLARLALTDHCQDTIYSINVCLWLTSPFLSWPHGSSLW